MSTKKKVKKSDIHENMSEDKPPIENFTKEVKTSHVCMRCLSYIWWTIWTILTLVVIFYITFGLLTLFSTQMKMEMIFLNRLNQPFFVNLSNCKDFGIVKCEDVQLEGGQGKLGAWLISPSTDKYITREAYILYLHGNMGSRALDHRVQLYKKLSRMGYHILVFDYRGFGDSEGYPSEYGLIEDSKVAYKYLKQIAHGRALYIWGHSLGSAVGIQLASWINSQHSHLNGMILEAPFNNMVDAIKQTPIAQPIIPFLQNFESYIEDVKDVFKSDHWIKRITSPVLIIHDVSDHILNINLARKLYASGKETGSTNVHMIELNENLNHNYLLNAKYFIKFIEEFVWNTS